MISIIIPHYNNQSTIKRTLISVISQTYQVFEIIVVDDYSKDISKTEKIINGFNDNRIKLFKHTKNKNGAAARNTGIKKAKGKYIAFLDADDEWLSEHLEKSLSAIKEESCDLVYSKCNVKTSNFPDLVMPQYKIKQNQKIGDYLFCDKGFVQTSSILTKAEIAKKILFNEMLIRHQDYDFLLSFEAFGGKMAMSDHVGTIVHWENNDIEKKGGTWQYSLNWAIEYKTHLSSKAYSGFIFKNVILPLLKKKKRSKAIKIFKQHIKIKNLSKKDIYCLFSYFCFSKLIIPKWIIKK